MHATEPTVSLRPEEALLLCCARTHLEAGHVEQLSTLVSQDLDWSALLRMAGWHRLIPLLSQHLHRTCPDSVPPAILTSLQRKSQTSVRRNLRLSGALCKLVQLCETHHIPVLPWKGPVLAQTLYGNLTLRPFSDLDILVRKQDLVRVAQLLLEQGYESRLSPLRNRARQTFHYHWDLQHQDGQVQIDLHWTFLFAFWRFPLTLERLQTRLIPVSFAGTTVQSLPPEELLLTLCIHGGRHQWKRLGWLCDIAELLGKQNQIDWKYLLELIQQLRRQRSVWLGLLLARDVLGATLPDIVEEKIQADKMVPNLVTHVRSQLFSSVHMQAGPEPPSRFQRDLREHWADGLWDVSSYALYIALQRLTSPS